MDSARSKRSYTFWWVFQRFSGVILLATLLGHMLLVHFRLSDFTAVSLKPEEVAQRYGDPLMQLFYALFLSMAVLHGINGLLNVVDDYIRNDFWRMVVTWLAWLLGLVVFIWGILTLV